MKYAPRQSSVAAPESRTGGTVRPASRSDAGSVGQILSTVCARIAPVWPLADYVAVNPYLGFAPEGFWATSQRLQRVSDCRMLMPLEYYRQRYQGGAFRRKDVELAIDELVESGVAGAELLTGRRLVQLLESPPWEEGPAADAAGRSPVRSISALFDDLRHTDWTAAIHHEIGKHCAAYYDQGQSPWPLPWKHLSLYEAWRAAMRHDRNLEVQGLNGVRELVQGLPSTPEAAIAQLLRTAGVPAAAWEDYLLCLAYELPGWSAWAQYQSRWVEDGLPKVGDGAGDDLAAVLAIRLACDVAVANSFGLRVDWSAFLREGDVERATADDAPTVGDLALYALQRSLEIGYRNRLLADLRAPSPAVQGAQVPPRRKHAQLVFCIDVRSERMRRRLEAVDDGLETLGFAGFFGLPIRVQRFGEQRAANQLPVLVPPRINVREEIGGGDAHAHCEAASRLALRQRARKAWKVFQSSTATAYAFVETTGLFFGLKLALRSLGWPRRCGAPRSAGLSPDELKRLGPSLASLADQGFGVAEQAELAASILRGMGLTRDFAPLVVLCGHGCETANNPLKAGLDCGACGGHSGEPNARLAAQLMNSPAVRAALQTHGIGVPADVHFVAALHNTTTDEITFFDEDLIPDSHADAMAALRAHVLQASAATRAERRPLVDSPTVDDVFRRARDWSEVRPEWGLAGNAAFIAGPRWLTEGVDLQGRAFLHNYDHRRDPDGQVLEVILSAPMVVASWINLQYFASTVDQRHFGSGRKTIHNVVGRFGVVAGNGGDLLTGLPWESIHDGHAVRHDPLRLLAVIAAPRAMISRLLARRQSVRDLAVKGWIHLVACEDGEFYRLTAAADWEPIALASGVAISHPPAEAIAAGG